jgi:hypothetical protein
MQPPEKSRAGAAAAPARLFPAGAKSPKRRAHALDIVDARFVSYPTGEHI